MSVKIKNGRTPGLPTTSREIGEASSGERRLEEVWEGLRRRAFIPAYQPIVSLPERRVIAFEALARWRRADGGLAEPREFAAALEDPHLARRITEALAENAVRDAAALNAEGVPFGRIGVNLAPIQLADGGFADLLLDHLDAAALPLDKFYVEVTETARFQRGGPGFTALERLASAGMLVALDDFGTGFGSLTHLRLPFFSWVKMDISFTHDLPEDPAAAAIMRRSVSLTRDLGFLMVAEGVENAEVEASLIQLGCPAAQGYHYARPAPFAEIRAALRRDGLDAYARSSEGARDAR